MSRLYLAGPMRGKSLYNWPAFYAAAEAVRAKGHDVVNPAEIDEHLGVVDVERTEDGTILDVRLTDKYDLEMILGRDLEEVVACDGIVMLDGWHYSEGARKEHEAAVCADLRVFYTLEQVPTVDVEQPNWWAMSEPGPDVAGRDVLGEIRVVDPETGGAKGSKPCQLFSAPPAGLEALGRVCGMGADKYELHNFRRGFAWSLSANAMLRHYLAWNAGEDVDPESGVNHMAHVAWHALVLIQFSQDHPEKDDRYRP